MLKHGFQLKLKLIVAMGGAHYMQGEMWAWPQYRGCALLSYYLTIDTINYMDMKRPIYGFIVWVDDCLGCNGLIYDFPCTLKCEI